MRSSISVLFLLIASSCYATGAEAPRVSSDAGHYPSVCAQADCAALLDAWHQAASVADGEVYFGSMTEDAVFLGTDATERWTREEFRAYAEPYFSKGRGWTYVPRDRHIAVGPRGDVAWVDERLDNEKYGELRGTGVLRREGGGWKIVHYSMTFPIPNEISGSVVELIRAER